jgi:hypothetical protein
MSTLDVFFEETGIPAGRKRFCKSCRTWRSELAFVCGERCDVCEERNRRKAKKRDGIFCGYCYGLESRQPCKSCGAGR